MEFRKRIIASYDGLFGERDEDEQEPVSDFSETTQFAKRWGWYQSIYAIAKGDITKFDEVTRMGLLKCLTYLTFEKQKIEIEQRQLNKLRR